MNVAVIKTYNFEMFIPIFKPEIYIWMHNIFNAGRNNL